MVRPPLENRYASVVSEAVAPPRGFANRVRMAVRWATLSALGAVTTSGRPAFLRCVYAHYVFDDQVGRFRAILRQLKHIGEFVDTDACVSMLTGNVPIDGRYFHLSFDDGFRNLCRNAAPVLVELNVPAIVFVPTAYVGAGWDAAKRYSLETLRSAGVIELLDWNDLRALQACRIDVGSHTRTHARLASLVSDSARDDEIAGSKREIEERLGTRCDYIAWPFGTDEDIDDASLAATRRAGYRACFGAFRGSVHPESVVDPFRIPRHHFEVQWPMRHVRYFAYGGME